MFICPSTYRLPSAWLIAAISRISAKVNWRIVLCVIANIADLDLSNTSGIADHVPAMVSFKSLILLGSDAF